jgi:zinc transporter ZupT
MESTGCAIGLGLESAPEIVGALILSVAGGTFIYVACTEILVEEFSSSNYRVLKFISFCFGALIIILLWFSEAA